MSHILLSCCLKAIRLGGACGFEAIRGAELNATNFPHTHSL